jgi:hypothetical protein
VFWSSVEIANPDGLLRRGMTGTALIRLDGGDPGALSKLRLGVWRLLS